MGTPAADFYLQEYLPFDIDYGGFPPGPYHTLSQYSGKVVMLFVIGYA